MPKPNAPKKLTAVAVLTFVLAVAPAAPAAFTDISATSGGELDLTAPGGLLDQLYGLDNLVRIDDFAAAHTDQHWHYLGADTAVNVTFRAKYAGFTHQFGLISDGGDFTALLNSGKSYKGVYPTGSAPAASAPGGPADTYFNLGLYINNTKNLWSSVPADNTLQQGSFVEPIVDQMVTYAIIGRNNHPTNAIGSYVVAWEDCSPTRDKWYDADYNDLVVEVAGVAPAPEPATLAFLAVGLVFLRPRRSAA